MELLNATLHVDEDDAPGMAWNRHLVDGRGNRYAFMATCGDNDGLAKAIALQMAASWNACSGVPTAALAPGLVGEIVEVLKKLHHDIRDLMANSGGVYGLHRNGDDAPWDTLTGNGRFQEWLGPAMDGAQALLARIGKAGE